MKRQVQEDGPNMVSVRQRVLVSISLDRKSKLHMNCYRLWVCLIIWKLEYQDTGQQVVGSIIPNLYISIYGTLRWIRGSTN